MFVKVKQKCTSEHEKELAAAQRELSPTGWYKVVNQEVDAGETFFYLMGAMSPYSAYLFDKSTET